LRTALGRFAAAEADARTGLEVEPTDSVLEMLLGNALLRQLRFDEAIEVYGQILTGRPDDVWARWLLSVATVRSGAKLSSLPEALRITYPRPDGEPAPVRFFDRAHELGTDALSRGRGVAWADFDKDGLYDVFAVGISDPHVLYRNDGNGTFTDVTDPSGLKDPRGGWSALATDYDNDGDTDLYVKRRMGGTPAQ
jgi:tetratricopeptide (TPR) repeat protein